MYPTLSVYCYTSFTLPVHTLPKYQQWNCCQNTFAELTQICGSRDESLDIRNGVHAGRLFSRAPEWGLPAPKLQIWSSGCTIGFELHLNIWCDTTNLPFQLPQNAVPISDTAGGGSSLRIGWRDLKFHALVAGQVYRPINLFFGGTLDLMANILLGPVALVPTSLNSCCSWWWNNLSKVLHLTADIWRIMCFN